jgi:hypothetical protein
MALRPFLQRGRIAGVVARSKAWRGLGLESAVAWSIHWRQFCGPREQPAGTSSEEARTMRRAALTAQG